MIEMGNVFKGMNFFAFMSTCLKWKLYLLIIRNGLLAEIWRLSKINPNSFCLPCSCKPFNVNDLYIDIIVVFIGWYFFHLVTFVSFQIYSVLYRIIVVLLAHIQHVKVLYYIPNLTSVVSWLIESWDWKGLQKAIQSFPCPRLNQLYMSFLTDICMASSTENSTDSLSNLFQVCFNS